jgi:phenylpropionate dioxygenase-like ring-hydroxylating dioxygenase large terminal subunit
MIRQLESPQRVPTRPLERETVGWPKSWYLICPSAGVARGRLRSVDFLGQPVVLFRDAAGHVRALAAHCAHMGAHLGRGETIGDCVRCPLHRWQWDGDGTCRSGSASARQPSLAASEDSGVVFLHNGGVPLLDPPAFSQDEAVRTVVGPPVTIACAGGALVANGFDVQHLEAVHGRALREPAIVDRPDRWTIRLSYVSRVTGRGMADRALKWISGDTIRVRVTCRGGSIVIVESEAGSSRSQLMLGITPIDAKTTRITPVFATPRTGCRSLDVARLAITRWLFTSFLKKDVAVLEHMRWPPPTTWECVMEDPSPAAAPLKCMLAFLDSLPRGVPMCEEVL